MAELLCCCSESLRSSAEMKNFFAGENKIMAQTYGRHAGMSDAAAESRCLKRYFIFRYA
jgi:hypothetical protein